MILACNTAPKVESSEQTKQEYSLSELLSDTLVESKPTSQTNIDSIEKYYLKQLKLPSTKAIESYNAEQLSDTYARLLNLLKKQGDSSITEQNKLLFTVFEKLNSQQLKLDETVELEIKTKLLLARTKSEIWPFFKK